MTTHLNALQLRLSNERARLANAKSEKEKELRKVYVVQLEKEIAGEQKFLGLQADCVVVDELSDEDLLKELGL